MRFSAYPNYKASGIEWLTDIPVHWKVMRVKHTTYVKGRIGWQGLRFDEFIDEGPFLVTGTDFKKGRIGWSTCYHISEERYREDPYIQLRENDLLITKDGTIGKVAIVNSMSGPASLNSGVFLTRAKGSSYETRFMYWVLSSEVFTSFIEASKSGTTIAHLYQNVFVEFAYPVPSLQEQRAIADFLDRKTAEIDTLVDKKEELIEKLKERRSALISRTVTRGLPNEAARAAGPPPQPKLKPSGIEWLGLVPDHWEVKTIFRLSQTIQTGPFGSQLHESDYVERGIPLINPAHIIGDALMADDDSTVDEKTAERLSRHRMRAGDIVMGRRGEIGRCSVVTSREEGWLCGTGSLVIRLRGCDPKYFGKLFSSSGFRGLLELNAVGTTMLNLSPSIVGRMLVPVPPLPEQLIISDFLERETAKIDSLVSKVEEAIERLQEYRTALITAAVTGKIDVRNASKSAARGASE